MGLLIFFGLVLIAISGKWIYEGWRNKKEAEQLDLHNDDWRFDEEEL